ncbi:MAG: ArsA family ATPase [Candidatus Bathyarchaeota archaeon]|nr:ArsA family ATPase [Candidatus Bathyarchaeota archaeon]
MEISDVVGLNFVEKMTPRIVMFTGKGGTGKTTVSSATAVHFALKGHRTLLISTDPSPSLSDILERDVKGKVTAIETVPNLSAVELDYDLVIELWKEKYGDEVYDVVSSFLPIGREIIEYIAGAPGIDQEFALSYLLDLYTSGDYDIIVWDTAPAGGTLALLNLQDTFYQHLGEAARLYVKVRNALTALTMDRAKRDPLKIIGEWEQLAKDVLDMMRDDTTLGFVVTNPEALCVSQAKRVVSNLEKFGIEIGGIVLNRVITEDAADNEFNRTRREVQRKYVDELNDAYIDVMPIVQVPMLSFEVKGVDALQEVAGILFPSNHA